MKRFLFSFLLFVFINANCQVSDSLGKMEGQRSFNEGFFENVIGKALPSFTAKDLNGLTYTTSEISNRKTTFINFWFTGCMPCIEEIPNLNTLYEMTKSKPDVQFFAITWDSEVQAKETIKKYNIKFPVLLIPQSQASQVTFDRGYPTNMVLDKEGKVFSILSGGSRQAGNEFEKYWDREIDKILRGDIPTISEPAQTQKKLSTITFIDSSKLQSFNDFENYFKNQSLYIDIWASWCLPCIEEFSSKNEAVDSFLTAHNVTRLYLSIDNHKKKKTWENLIYKYELAGYHLLAGSELIKEIRRNIFKSETTIEIPRYIIVKKGKIVELNAFPPSDGEKLISQLIKKLL